MINLRIENTHEGTTEIPTSYTFIVIRSPPHYVTGRSLPLRNFHNILVL